MKSAAHKKKDRVATPLLFNGQIHSTDETTRVTMERGGGGGGKGGGVWGGGGGGGGGGVKGPYLQTRGFKFLFLELKFIIVGVCGLVVHPNMEGVV